MTPEGPTTGRTASSGRHLPAASARWPGVLAAGLAVLALFHLVMTRLSWAQIPLQTDTGIWAYIGGRLLEGAHLYRDLWEQKPPGIYYTFAAVIRLFGNDSVTALLWLDAAVSVAVLAVTYRVARRFASRPAAVGAVCLLSVVFCHRVLADWGDNVEKFVAFFEMSACLMLFRGLRRSDQSMTWLATGAMCGCAALFKQTGILFILAVLTSAMWRGIKREWSFSLVRRRLVVLLIGFAVPWVLVAFWLIGSGIAGEFWTQVCLYEFQRVGSSERSRLFSVQHWASVWESLKLAGILLGPALVAVVLTRFKRNGRAADVASHSASDRGFALNVITIYWLATTFVLAIAPHGYGHYLLQAAPPAAVMTAWLIDQILRRTVGRTVTVATVVILLFGIFSLRDHFAFTFDAESPYRRNYALRAAAFDTLVAAIRQSTEPEQDVMIWPPSAAASFYARRRTPLERSNMEVIYRGRMNQLSPPMDELLRRLVDHPPDVIVDWSPIKYIGPSDQTRGEPVLLTSQEGYSLLEPPNDSHQRMEGRILAPLKRWVRENYGGQRQEGPAVLFFRGRPWRHWEDVLLPVEKQTGEAKPRDAGNPSPTLRKSWVP